MVQHCLFIGKIGGWIRYYLLHAAMSLLDFSLSIVSNFNSTKIHFIPVFVDMAGDLRVVCEQRQILVCSDIFSGGFV